MIWMWFRNLSACAAMAVDLNLRWTSRSCVRLAAFAASRDGTKLNSLPCNNVEWAVDPVTQHEKLVCEYMKVHNKKTGSLHAHAFPKMLRIPALDHSKPLRRIRLLRFSLRVCFLFRGLKCSWTTVWIPRSRIFGFGVKIVFFGPKIPYVAIFYCWGWLVGWLWFVPTFRNVCHPKKITVPLDHRSPKKVTSERVPGLLIRDCTGSSDILAQMCPNLSAIDVTEKTFFEPLYLVLG